MSSARSTAPSPASHLFASLTTMEDQMHSGHSGGGGGGSGGGNASPSKNKGGNGKAKPSQVAVAGSRAASRAAVMRNKTLKTASCWPMVLPRS